MLYKVKQSFGMLVLFHTFLVKFTPLVKNIFGIPDEHK